MIFIQVLLTTLTVSSVYAIGHMMDVGGHGGMMGGKMGGHGGGMHGMGGGMYHPKSFGFGYQAKDHMGNNHHRNEHGDGMGTVKGSYGYTDMQGLYRIVDYVADASGFKAHIRTNEPGTKDHKMEHPAHVQLHAEHPPPGVQEKYTRLGGHGMAGNLGHLYGGMGGGMMKGGMGMKGGMMGLMGGGMHGDIEGMGGGMGEEMKFGMGGGMHGVGIRK